MKRIMLVSFALVAALGVSTVMSEEEAVLNDKLNEITVEELEAAEAGQTQGATDRKSFVDFSVDLSYGHPKMGYVYNGIHFRKPTQAPKYRYRPRGKRADDSTFIVPFNNAFKTQTPSHYHIQSQESSFNPTFNFDKEFSSIRQGYKSPRPQRQPQQQSGYQTAFTSPSPPEVNVHDVTLVVEEEVGQPYKTLSEPVIYETPEVNQQHPLEATIAPATFEPTPKPPQQPPKREIQEHAYVEPQPPVVVESSLYTVEAETEAPEVAEALYYEDTKHQPEQQHAEQYNYPPYVSPHEAPSSHPTSPDPHYVASPSNSNPNGIFLPTAEGKPPLHIKIKQDLRGLVGSVRNIFRAKSKEGTEASASPFDFNGFSLKTPPGKPPLMQKIRQDFLGFFGGSSSPSSGYGAPSYEAPAPSYATPEPPTYETPSYEPPAPVYETPAPVYETPEPTYAPPSSNYESSKSTSSVPVASLPSARRPFLDKMMSDIGRVNRWMAKTASEGMANARMPELQDLNPFNHFDINRLRRREDLRRSAQAPVMQYINAPDLSYQEQEQQPQQQEFVLDEAVEQQEVQE